MSASEYIATWTGAVSGETVFMAILVPVLIAAGSARAFRLILNPRG
jgi:ABC-type antimicrobial peptide transport system permease subunit